MAARLTAEERARVEGGWRMGKPEEDPEKTKSWGKITARPSEFLVHVRRGTILPTSGQGSTCFKRPGDAVAVVPTTLQRLRFTADQVTRERVGVQVTGIAIYRIADPRLAFRMLNFSFPERAQEKLEQVLGEMFIGAARRLVANLGVEDCLSKRKEGLATELIREIAPVVSGTGRPDDATDRGWGIVIDTIEIQDVRVLSEKVFADMQAPFRASQTRQAREAALSADQAVRTGEAEAERIIAIARVTSEREVAELKQSAKERAALAELEMEARLAEGRHAEALAELAREAELARTRAEAALARKAALEAELATAELEARRQVVAMGPELHRLRAQKTLENDVSPMALQLAIARRLPRLATALGNVGPVHVMAMDGANPFGFIASMVQGLMGIARAAGDAQGGASRIPPEGSSAQAGANPASRR